MPLFARNPVKRLVRAGCLLACGFLGIGAQAALAQADCGSAKTPCKTALGEYHIRLPKGPGPYPVMVFLHGYGGHGAPMLRSGTAREALSRGYAFIAPEGLARPGSGRQSWSFNPDWPQQRDEHAFFQQVLQDAAKRFDVDPAHAVLAGFSAGGFMTSYLACEHPDDFVAYAAVAGSFWRPEPTECAGPVRLFQTDGWADTVVPLEGRPLRVDNGRVYEQGDIFQALQIWRRANKCPRPDPSKTFHTGQFWRRAWDDCAPGSDLQFALHDGGHGIPAGWPGMVFDWLAGLDVTRAAQK